VCIGTLCKDNSARKLTLLHMWQ